jgi:hypothetical protein
MNNLIYYFGLDIIKMNYVNFDEILQKKFLNNFDDLFIKRTTDLEG